VVEWFSSSVAAIHRRVSPEHFAERRGGARPVADAPVDELLGRADELARRWALSLVAARALREMAGVPLAQLALEAPELCAQLLRALRSDAELAQLIEPSGAHERSSGERRAALWRSLAPDGDAAPVVHDVEALRSIVWTAVRGELRDPPPSQVADLADRLAFVCASLLAAVLGRLVPEPSAADTTPAASARSREQILYSPAPGSPSGRGAVLIDELAEAVAGPARTAVTAPRGARVETRPFVASRSKPSPTSHPVNARPHGRPWDTPLDAAARTDGPEAQDAAASRRAVPESQGAPAAVRVTRGPGSPADGSSGA
jgi:hypothetical protein